MGRMFLEHQQYQQRLDEQQFTQLRTGRGMRA